MERRHVLYDTTNTPVPYLRRSTLMEDLWACKCHRPLPLPSAVPLCHSCALSCVSPVELDHQLASTGKQSELFITYTAKSGGH